MHVVAKIDNFFIASVLSVAIGFWGETVRYIKVDGSMPSQENLLQIYIIIAIEYCTD